MNTRQIITPLFRVTGVSLLILGILFWTGRALDFVQLHMRLGMLFVVLYLVLIFMAKLKPKVLVPAILLGLILPVFGMMQTRLLVGELHWIIRVVHLLLAVAAMAIVTSTSKASAPTS
jgi:hypothetical protein